MFNKWSDTTQPTTSGTTLCNSWDALLDIISDTTPLTTLANLAKGLYTCCLIRYYTRYYTSILHLNLFIAFNIWCPWSITGRVFSTIFSNRRVPLVTWRQKIATSTYAAVFWYHVTLLITWLLLPEWIFPKINPSIRFFTRWITISNGYTFSLTSFSLTQKWFPSFFLWR